ncbi:MAG: hypothetical protein IMZ52_10080 [Actinobacteria bacterium]|nr:hypothetical protein [Actinomycetota bacterium]MBE3122586.1 hypothetical protein [Thermoplasmata archaeon]
MKVLIKLDEIQESMKRSTPVVLGFVILVYCLIIINSVSYFLANPEPYGLGHMLVDIIERILIASMAITGGYCLVEYLFKKKVK